jgi:hypothetical protein
MTKNLYGRCLQMVSSARNYLIIAGLLCALVVLSKPAVAVPSLSRKYSQACSTCHSPGFPRLNDFGKFSKEAGYFQEGGKEVSLGDWLRMSELPPIGVLIKAYALRHNRSSGVVFDTPHEYEIMWADSLGPTFSVFGELEFEYGEAEAGSTYLDWHSQDRKWSLRAGNFAPSDWLAKEIGTGHFRLTRARYRFEEVREGDAQRIGRDSPGFMIYGRPAQNWWFDLAVVDGDSDNKHKDFWAHTSFAFSNGILVAPFFYTGKYGMSPSQDFTQAGVGVSVPLKTFSVSGASPSRRPVLMWIRGNPETTHQDSSGSPILSTTAPTLKGDTSSATATPTILSRRMIGHSTISR